MVFAPIHWNRAFASDARVGALTNPVVDPISGEPELKHTPVSIEHFAADWYGVMLTRSAAAAAGDAVVDEGAGRASSCATSWPATIRATGRSRRAACSACRRRVLADVDWIEYRDPARPRVSRGVVRRRPARGLHLLRPPARVAGARAGSRGCSRGAQARCGRARRLWRAARSKARTRARWCARVSASARNPIAACARELGAAATPVEIGKRLKCGTNCGSCIPEIQGDHRRGREEDRLRSFSPLLIMFAASTTEGIP